jgi:hypothetical protein
MEGKTKMQQFKELDFGGMFLMCSGMVLVLLGISFGGVNYPWKSVGAIVPIVVGTVLLVVFGFYGKNWLWFLDAFWC